MYIRPRRSALLPMGVLLQAGEGGMTNKSHRGIRLRVAKKFSRGTLGFGVLVTVFLLIAFGLIVVFSHFYPLVFLAPVLAGFIIGHYSKGGLHGGEAGFIGVCVTALIILLLGLTLSLIASSSFIIILWNISTIALFALLLSPIICGLLGFVGGFASSLVVKRIQPSPEMEIPPPPPPSEG